MSTQQAVHTCTAVPAAARRWGRADQTCGATAHLEVDHGGTEHPVCEMHLQSWMRATDRDELAAKWGWA